MFPSALADRIKEFMGLSPIIPVIEIDNPEHAEPLASALMDGGISIVEVTLRTPAALEAIERFAKIPDLAVGAGTLLVPAHVKSVVEAGARFGVSPGATEELIESCREADLPILPGAATVSEMMRLSDMGLFHQKFFPAEASGGIPALKSIAAPLPHLFFCPTGGVSKLTVENYLALPNVLCVGGSWIAPRNLIREQDWGTIAENARASLAQLKGT